MRGNKILKGNGEVFVRRERRREDDRSDCLGL